MNRCEACGATNPASAQWCGQCLRRFDSPAPPASAPPAAEAPVVGGKAAAPAEGAPAFRQADRGFEWACTACGTYSPLEERACVACGYVLVLHGDASEGEVDWARVRRRNLFAPGAGHLATRHRGIGLGVLFLWGVWLLSGVLLATQPGGAVMAMPLLAGALFLWTAVQVDGGRLAQGQPAFLDGRVVLWAVVGVTLLVVVAAVAASGQATPANRAAA